MIEYENECCGCATENYPCMGDTCPNRHVAHYYCDECGEEGKLYKYGNKQLCKEHFIEFTMDDAEIVEGSDSY